MDSHVSMMADLADSAGFELRASPPPPRPIMAVCTDSSRHGCAIYSESVIQLIADRKDAGDPYKGLDIVIQRIDPEVVIASSVQRKLIDYLEKRFKFKIWDISRREARKLATKRPGTDHTTAAARTGLGPTPAAITNPAQSTQRSRLAGSASQSVDPTELNQAGPGESTPQELEFRSILASEENETVFTLVIVPNFWFCMSKGWDKLVGCEIVKRRGLTDLEEQNFFILSKVNKSTDVCAIRSISALENYIIHSSTKEMVARPITPGRSTQSTIENLQYHSQLSKQTDVSQEAFEQMPIIDLKYTDPGPVLSIDKHTLRGLNIFPVNEANKRQDKNTNQAQAPDSIPSLFELLNQCQSLQGKRQMRTMMLWPLQDLDEIEHRLDAVQFFVRADNRLLREQLILHLRNVIPLSSLLTKLDQTVATYKELHVIYKALWAVVAVVDIAKANQNYGLEIISRITELDSPELRAVVDLLICSIDFEASRREKRVQVCLGVDDRVDEKKEIVKNLAKFCDEVAIQETIKYKDILGKTCNVLYLPRIGFLNSINFNSTSELQNIVTNKEFDVLLHTEQSVYFKTKRMEELDNNAGDIACDLIDVQETIVVEIQNELLKLSETVLRLIELCGELDCLIAFSIVSSERAFSRPSFAEANEGLDIRQCFHPLHSARYPVISNDVKFYKETSQRLTKVMVITGPNSCGKTTYMKTACLVIYMAHIGCFVPAMQARIPVVDAILSRLHSSNSISTGLSSFATDCHQINYAIDCATERSLIVVDEFGKGTHARDGSQLLKGLIAYFASRGQNSPYVMVSTHYNSLIAQMSHYSEYILYKTLKVSREKEKNKIVYEFKLVDGICESSLADEVATKVGIPHNIIQRAQQIKDYIIEGREIRHRPPFPA